MILTATKTGRFSMIPIMTGTVKTDGIGLPKQNDFGRKWNQIGANRLYKKSSFNKSETTDEEVLLANLIKQYYIGKTGLLNESLTEFVEMITDNFYLSPDQKLAELASIYVPVYNYR